MSSTNATKTWNCRHPPTHQRIPWTPSKSNQCLRNIHQHCDCLQGFRRKCKGNTCDSRLMNFFAIWYLISVFEDSRSNHFPSFAQTCPEITRKFTMSQRTTKNHPKNSSKSTLNSTNLPQIVSFSLSDSTSSTSLSDSLPSSPAPPNVGVAAEALGRRRSASARATSPANAPCGWACHDPSAHPQWPAMAVDPSTFSQGMVDRNCKRWGKCKKTFSFGEVSTFGVISIRIGDVTKHESMMEPTDFPRNWANRVIS